MKINIFSAKNYILKTKLDILIKIFSAKKQPPPTLPKPKKPTKVSPPVVAPKPKLSPAATNGAEKPGAAVNGGQSFQDETLDGSEV